MIIELVTFNSQLSYSYKFNAHVYIRVQLATHAAQPQLFNRACDAYMHKQTSKLIYFQSAGYQ